MKLPNDKLAKLDLVEDLAVQLQNSDAGELEARPRDERGVEGAVERAALVRELLVVEHFGGDGGPWEGGRREGRGREARVGDGARTPPSQKSVHVLR